MELSYLQITSKWLSSQENLLKTVGTTRKAGKTSNSTNKTR